MNRKQHKLTHKEAIKQALEKLGGRARLRDIYPLVIPYIVYKPGSDIRATLRRQLQTTPELFRHTEKRRGWWELVSYQEELAVNDRKFEELGKLQLTKDDIIRAFNNNCDNLIERVQAKLYMQMLFGGNKVWLRAYKEMKQAGYFDDPQITMNNPQFGSLYKVTGNKKVIIGKV